jgi:hypothetical protein
VRGHVVRAGEQAEGRRDLHPKLENVFDTNRKSSIPDEPNQYSI